MAAVDDNFGFDFGGDSTESNFLGGEKETKSFDIALSCSRCAKGLSASKETKSFECESCHNTYCDSCQGLSMLKNMCETRGGKHGFVLLDSTRYYILSMELFAKKFGEMMAKAEEERTQFRTERDQLLKERGLERELLERSMMKVEELRFATNERMDKLEQRLTALEAKVGEGGVSSGAGGAAQAEPTKQLLLYVHEGPKYKSCGSYQLIKAMYGEMNSSVDLKPSRVEKLRRSRAGEDDPLTNAIFIVDVDGTISRTGFPCVVWDSLRERFEGPMPPILFLVWGSSDWPDKAEFFRSFPSIGRSTGGDKSKRARTPGKGRPSRTVEVVCTIAEDKEYGPFGERDKDILTSWIVQNSKK